jgi:predicted ATPase
VRIRLLGSLRVEHDGTPVAVSGAMQLAVLFRLAVDAGSAVSYRAIAEDIWSTDAPENAKAALQSIVSRLRSQLPPGSIESAVGGYRLAVARDDVDALVFSDLVARAVSAKSSELAAEALALWTGEPWVPSVDFDWFERDLRRDHVAATALAESGRGASAPVPGAPAPGSPAATTPARPRGNVPAPLTALVGRENELAAVAAQLNASRLVTVVGPGGAGKTRLAVEAAGRRPAALLVEFAPVGADELVSAVLAATGRELRTADAPNEPVTARERVLEALAGREVLLVLDNCEHVIDAAARLAADLLAALPALRILATSREPLGIPGEAFVALGSLDHPAESLIGDLTAQQLGGYAAVELFRQRASAANSGSSVDLATAARVCARLDGLPLAIELAAARLRTMTADEVLAGLEDRFTLLTGGYRTALPRHQTLRAMIDWSWSLLTADEQHALARLAVFPAGIDAGDTARLARAMGLASASVFDSLVDKSLLTRSRGRFRALETIREYGIERLAESGELADAREAQARYLTRRAGEFDRLLRGPRIFEAIAWFDSEEDNISSALRYTTSTGMAAEAVALGVSCGWYWTIRDRQDDVRSWFAVILPLAAGLDSEGARLIGLLAPVVAAFSGTAGSDNGEDRVRESPEVLAALEAARKVEPAGAGANELLQVLPPLLEAFATAVRGAEWMITVSLPHGEDLGLDPWPCALLHVVAAALAQNRGDIETLGVESQLAVQQFERIGDLWGLALAQQMRSEWLALNGRLDEALAIAAASTGNMRHITSEWDLAQQQGLAITLLTRLGRLDEARQRADDLLAEADANGNAPTVLQALLLRVSVDVLDRDLAAARARMARFDSLVGSWPHMPGQLAAVAEVFRSSVAILAGDTDAAENALRAAAAAALATQDHPIIGSVALGFGSLALAKGDVPAAVRALDLSTAIVGAYNADDLQVIAIERAAARHGIERGAAAAPSRSTLSRSAALDTLKQLSA